MPKKRVSWMPRLGWAGRSVRTRLTLLISLTLLLGFLATDFISYQVSTATLRDAILHDELPLTSNNIYSDIQADLLRPILVSSLMSHDTFVRDWLLGGEKDLPAITRYLDEIHSRYGAFTSFLVSNKTHTYYHFNGIARHVDESDPGEKWFARVRAMQQPYEINVDSDQVTGGTLTIFINARVLDYSGQFVGVTGIGLKLDTVAKVISRYHAKYNRNIYFVDGTGAIVVRSPGAAITEANINDAPGLRAQAATVLGMNEGYLEYRYHGQEMLLTTRLIPELGWHVVVEQREADAFRGLWHGFLANAAIGIGVVAAITAIIGATVNLYQRRLEEMAVTDKLTGLGNRLLFETAFARLLGTRRNACVILFDIDHFKRINDTLGHLKGDSVIRRVAELTGGMMRTGDTVCRWGGEEIIILLPDCTREAAVAIAERLRAAVAAAVLFTPDDGSRITISLGVTDIAGGDSEDDVLSRIDTAMYRAKREGRDRVVFLPAAG